MRITYVFYLVYENPCGIKRDSGYEILKLLKTRDNYITIIKSVLSE